MTERAFVGTALHAPMRGQLVVLRDKVWVVGSDGAIKALHARRSADGEAVIERHRESATVHILEDGQYWLPGMVDLHVHAPQWPQLGLALDEPLEIWLQKFTFPLEARYSDLTFAEAVYESLVETLLANGTTTAVYYASIHLAATQKLADICLRRSQRALIGRVAMDNEAQCPAFYRDPSAVVALADTRSFISYVHSMSGNAGLISPVITPRFIPACTDELLHGLGSLAHETGCHVQTHCSESDWEHRFVLERCGISDTRALENFGLLSRRTVLAHGNFVGEEDMSRIEHRGSGIAHCPLSNVYFSDAVFPLRRLLERGVHVGLGTDIAGGASPSILENARHAVIASRLLESGVDPLLERQQRRRDPSRIDARTAFWLATAGGGIALDLPIGLLTEGYQFDAIVIDSTLSGSNLHSSGKDEPDTLLQKILYHATRANIAETWVAGRRAASRIPFTAASESRPRRPAVI